jgi:hypothetical protein
MSNIYIGYHFNIEPKELGSEIIAELGEKHSKVLPKQKRVFQHSFKKFMG